MQYHPHVHYLVPGGGLASDGQTWRRAKNHFFVHVKPLARLFRAKFRAALRKADLFAQVSAATWRQDWVVDCRPVGTGEAALKYLAPYVFRVALSNNRIRKLANDQVTFTYKEGDPGKPKRCTVPAQEFMRRFLQHVLPKHFVKVRYYGYYAPGNRHVLHQVKAHLPDAIHRPVPRAQRQPPATDPPLHPPRLVCPRCGQVMHVKQILRPHIRSPP